MKDAHVVIIAIQDTSVGKMLRKCKKKKKKKEQITVGWVAGVGKLGSRHISLKIFRSSHETSKGKNQLPSPPQLCGPFLPRPLNLRRVVPPTGFEPKHCYILAA